MEEIEKPSYYAILPADVRYDDRLSAREKLLYAEITALSNKEGYCWAGNTYFANLYNSTNRTIITAINNLENFGYLRREMIYKKNSKEVQKRLLYPMTKFSLPSEENFTTPREENFTDNNTSINKTSINNTHDISFTYIEEENPTIKKTKKFIPPTLEEVEQYCKERNNSVNPKMFFDYYSVNDWCDGKGNKVKNWKQKLITWEKKDTNSKKKEPVNYVGNYNDWSDSKEIFEEYYRENCKNYDY